MSEPVDVEWPEWTCRWKCNKFPRFRASHPAVGFASLKWLGDEEISGNIFPFGMFSKAALPPPRRCTSVECHFAMRSSRCYRAIRIYYRQLERTNLCKVIRHRETAPMVFIWNTRHWSLKLTPWLLSEDSRPAQGFFGLIYFSGLWPQTHN